jgi:hypothetical protein
MGSRLPLASHPAPPPPALHDRALQDLSFIRRTMEGASSFTDVPGWGLAIIGATAVLAAVVAESQPSAGRWMAVWMVEALGAVVIGGAMTWRKMRQRGHTDDAPILSVPARKFLLGFWPAMLAGAVLTFALVDVQEMWRAQSVVPQVLPGLWLLLYGVSVTTAGAFSVRAVPLMGIGLMVLGVLALFLNQLPDGLMLALGFGVWQIGFGVWIARRHGG